MAASIVRRAVMYVPSSSKKMLSKALTLNVDTVAYDLEDSVSLAQKPTARQNLLSHLSTPSPSNIRETCIRINSIDTGLALTDLTTLLSNPSTAQNIDAIMVPKVQSAADMTFVTDVLRHLAPERHPTSPSPSNNTNQKPPIRLIALIESALAIQNLPTITSSTPYLSGLLFAAEDFALDLSLTRSPSLSEFLYARSAIVTAARAANLPSTIDLVCTSYSGATGLETLERECENGKGMGFNGKQVIHPSQIPVVQRAFSPGEKEVEWAVRVVVGNERAEERGRGAWTLDGKMIDAPVVGKCRRVLERAQVCGVDVEGVRERWAGQEPE
ncbi:citrate lyase-like protein subunit beta [Sporormia fimetaria CBS 119925]|uniref:Citrate lyase-like protein subunit beta n=1 Tax=Sporormia fimetaria CBS 119925 TaxID=1340428 RepID=A0A6A6VJ72_9PLEO|nr:citrate lyase-like protein subunit beta [Sporormia fimetaria CBS 119925]